MPSIWDLVAYLSSDTLAFCPLTAHLVVLYVLL